MEWVRSDITDVTHRDYGKLIPCPNPHHLNTKIEELSKRCGLKEHEFGYTMQSIAPLNDMTEDLIEVMRTFLDDPKGWLYMHGGSGNGKSLALMAAVNHYVNQGIAALYITFADLLDVMRETFKHKTYTTMADIGEDAWREWGTYQERFRRIQSLPLLAIDEFDDVKVNVTNFVTEFRTRLIDHRYRDAIGEETVTLFAGNQNPKHLPSWIYDRVDDARFVVFHHTGESVRKEMAW
jgi:DNA replication protein DnaC